jgi:hypothetical protein
MDRPRTLADRAVEVLTTADARAKTALSRRHAATWSAARADGARPEIGTASPPPRPAPAPRGAGAQTR